jgi:hypothetical protein
VLLATYLKLTFLAQLSVCMRANSMDEDANYKLGGRQPNNRWRVHGYVDRRRRVVRSAEGEFLQLPSAAPWSTRHTLCDLSSQAQPTRTHADACPSLGSCRAGASYGRWYLQTLEPGLTPRSLKYELRGDDGASIALTLEKA